MCMQLYTRECEANMYIIGEMHVCMAIQMKLHVGFNIRVSMLVSAHLQVNIHQTCRYID
jgi:hypothetical protein